MLLLWHEALGSDDEQAMEEELCARILYFQQDHKDSACLVQNLHAIQGLLTLVRMLRRKSSDEVETGWTPEWASVTLSKRRFYILEVEPQIFMALGVHPTVEIQHHKAGYEALLREIYDLFRLFHGSIDSNLRSLVFDDKGKDGTDGKATDGMDVLIEIGALRKQLRKLRMDMEIYTHSDTSANDQLHDKNIVPALQKDILLAQAALNALEAQSPAPILKQKCTAFFPTLLQALDVEGTTGLSEMQGLEYFPMDQHTFLVVQRFVNDFHMAVNCVDKLLGGLHVASSALFCKGNLVWTSIDTATMQLLYKFHRLREERGMTLIRGGESKVCDKGNVDHISESLFDSGLWMANAYEDTFRPIWSSKVSYAECDTVTQGFPHQRKTARSLHKQHSVSLPTFLSKTQSVPATNILPTSFSTPRAESLPYASPSQSCTPSDGSWRQKANSVTLKSAIKARVRCISYRNAGFLLKNGHFSKFLNTNKETLHQRALDEAKAVWSPQIFPVSGALVPFAAKRNLGKHRVVVWHEADLTMIMLLCANDADMDSSGATLLDARATTLKRLSNYFERHEQFVNLAQLILTRYNATFAREKKYVLFATTTTQFTETDPNTGVYYSVSNLHSLPPFVYINRINRAFRMRFVPRLFKRKEADVFPIPGKLLAHYFPASVLALVNELHADLHKSSSAGNREMCVRTRDAGWVLAKKSETSHSELYVFFDSNISSVNDLSGKRAACIVSHTASDLFQLLCLSCSIAAIAVATPVWKCTVLKAGGFVDIVCRT